MKYIIKNKKTIIVNIVVTFILIASLFWIINNCQFDNLQVEILANII